MMHICIRNLRASCEHVGESACTLSRDFVLSCPC
jgi:hypothetical protein